MLEQAPPFADRAGGALGTMLTGHRSWRQRPWARWSWRGGVALALYCLLLPQSPPTRAQAEQAPAIAIIDMQRILRESVAGQAVQKEIDQRRNQFQAELQQKEEGLRNASQELARQRAVLSSDAYARKRQELEREAADVRREMQRQRRGLDEVFGQGMTQVRLELVEIVKEIASERGADLVLAKTNVVLVRPDIEITDEAIARLNERLKSVPLAPAEN